VRAPTASNRGRLPLLIALILMLGAPAQAQADFNARLDSPLGFTKLVNEISLYQNTDSDFNSRGQTLQVISINTIKVFTEFNFEFTGDFNWDLDLYEDYDYYLELSLVKPVYGPLSFNYQQLHGTFLDGAIHQFGIRLSL
jgi:hypothetical protein